MALRRTRVEGLGEQQDSLSRLYNMVFEFA